MKFKKKPIVIEAFRLGIDPWPDWAWEKVTTNDIVIHGTGAAFNTYLTHAEINTLEGIMHSERGDYIIKGIQDEVYSCKPDIFLQTYEPVDD